MPINQSPQRQNECKGSRARLIVSLAVHNDADLPAVPGALRALYMDQSTSALFRVVCPECGALLGVRSARNVQVLNDRVLVDSMVNGVPVKDVTLPLHTLARYVPSTVVRTLTDAEVCALLDVAKYQMTHTRKPRVWMAAVDVVSILEEVVTHRKASAT